MSTTSTSECEVQGRISAATDLPEVRFLAATLGRYDLIATVQMTSLLNAGAVLDCICALRPVLQMDSWVHLETAKQVYRYPIPSMTAAC